MSLSSPSFVAMLEDTSGTVSSGFAWLSHPEPITIEDEGAYVTFDVIHNQSSGVVLVWQSSATEDGTYSDLSNGGDISGADTETLTISGLEDDDEKFYRCKATHSATDYFSSASRLIVIDDD